MAICDDSNELKIIVRCVVVASKEALTVNELWNKVLYVLGGQHCVKLNIFGYDTVIDYLKSIPDVVQLEDPLNENSLINLVSSELSRHMELLVCTNIIRPPTIKNRSAFRELLIPYRIQCAFIRIFYELYPQGLSIGDFVSEVLFIPIFKLFNDNVEVLLLNLDHIFKRNGLDVISLRPTILNSLKYIKETDKFTAADIYNIDEYSFENSNNDKSIVNGLEYNFFYMLEEPIKNNIEQLLDEEPDWIPERKICDLYIEKFGSSFAHFRRWGFSRVSQMLAKLPELCYVNFLDNGIEIISSKKYSPDKKNVIEEINEIEEFSLHEKNKFENKSEANDGVLKKFLRNDKLLEVSLDDCFLDQEIEHIELKINQSLNVKICRVNTNFIPSIICQNLDQINELQNLLSDMKRFYFMNESRFVFDPTITVLKCTYAFFFDDLWFRGIAIDNNSSSIKMINIDDGSIHNISYDDVRILYNKFSQLPAQSFMCYLNGIESIDEEVFSEILNKKCIIDIVSIDPNNKTANVKIKLENSTTNKYLNDEWIKNGFARHECSSDKE